MVFMVICIMSMHIGHVAMFMALLHICPAAA